MQQITDVLILGGGAAGYTAALYAARAGLSALVVERMSPGGQMATTDLIENYPGFPDGIDGFTLGMQMQTGAEKFGAKTVYGEVQSLELTAPVKQVTVDGEVYRSKAVILAMGASPRLLGLAGEGELTGRGVHYCAHCDGRFYKDKTVVVVGGGNSAVSAALYLSNLCKKVLLVHRRDSLRATRIYHEQLEKASNIEIRWNSRPAALVSENGRLTALAIEDVKTKEAQKIDADGVFVEIGRTPDTAIVKGQVTLDEYGYIVAGESTKTNLEGVFAAGDVRQKALRQIITAASDGAVAATMAEEYILGLEM